MSRRSHRADPPALPAANDGTSQTTSAELRALLADVDSALERERGVRGFLRALPTFYRWLIAGSIAVAMTASVSALVPRATAFHPGFRLTVSMGVYVLLFAVLVAQALRPLQHLETQQATVLGLGVLALVTPYILAIWPLATDLVGKPAFDCFPIGLLVGGVVIVALRLLDRAGDTEPRSILIAGAAAGLAGNFVLMFHCADDRPLHLLIGHAPLGVVLWFAYRKLEARSATRANQVDAQ